jgi:hypothetical protein
MQSLHLYNGNANFVSILLASSFEIKIIQFCDASLFKAL